MRGVGSLVPVKVHFGVARLETIVIALAALAMIVAIPGLEAFERGVALNHRSVHAEVVVTAQPGFHGPADDAVKERRDDAVLLQTRTIMRERGGVEGLLGRV